jgi:hypothetical protein
MGVQRQRRCRCRQGALPEWCGFPSPFIPRLQAGPIQVSGLRLILQKKAIFAYAIKA